MEAEEGEGGFERALEEVLALARSTLLAAHRGSPQRVPRRVPPAPLRSPRSVAVSSAAVPPAAGTFSDLRLEAPPQLPDGNASSRPDDEGVARSLGNDQDEGGVAPLVQSSSRVGALLVSRAGRDAPPAGIYNASCSSSCSASLVEAEASWRTWSPRPDTGSFVQASITGSQESLEDVPVVGRRLDEKAPTTLRARASSSKRRERFLQDDTTDSEDEQTNIESRLGTLINIANGVNTSTTARKNRQTSTMFHNISRVGTVVDVAMLRDNIWKRVVEWRLHSTKTSQLALFDAVMSTVIIANAIIIGLSMDLAPDWSGWIAVNGLFAVAFLMEMIAKMFAYGPKIYLLGPSGAWNVFECALAIFAGLEVFFAVVAESGRTGTPPVVFVIMRALRLFRIARVLRLARIPMFADLTLMVNGCLGGMKTLFWSQLLMALPLYVLALVFREAFGGKVGPDDEDTGPKGFQTVGLSFFTVYNCMVTGQCYTEGGAPIFVLLIKNWGHIWGAVYYLSSAFMSFGLANVITAIFVESTVASAKFNELRQKQLRLTDRKMFAESSLKLVELVWHHHADNTEQSSVRSLAREAISDILITPALFQKLNGMKEFQEVLSDLDIAREEQELLEGIEKMRGDARRSDIVSVGLVVRALAEELKLSQKDIREQLRLQAEGISTLQVKLLRRSRKARHGSPKASSPAGSMEEL